MEYVYQVAAIGCWGPCLGFSSCEMGREHMSGVLLGPPDERGEQDTLGQRISLWTWTPFILGTDRSYVSNRWLWARENYVN